VVRRAVFLQAYYTTCTGQNPLDPSLNSAQELVDEATAGINFLLTGVCAGNQALIDSQQEIKEIDYVFNNITMLLDCPPVQSEFQDVLNTGLCDQFYRGFWSIWISQNLTTTFVLVCTLIVCITYEYFGKYWNTKDTEDDGSDRIDFEGGSVYGVVIDAAPVSAVPPYAASSMSGEEDPDKIAYAN
jgi:hypothetical protein